MIKGRTWWWKWLFWLFVAWASMLVQSFRRAKEKPQRWAERRGSQAYKR
jgi:hypothetical protein